MRHKETPISTKINHLSGSESKWFAIYTKYKCEKYVTERLGKKGIAAYVPIITKIKQYTSRIKRFEVPLINCYVFVKITKDQYVKVLETEYIMSFIKQRGNLISIPDNEINLLKRIVGEIEDVSAGKIEMELGDEVEIIGGNLTGIKGRLIDNQGKNKFVIRLVSLGMQLNMTVDTSLLRLLKRKAIEL